MSLSNIKYRIAGCAGVFGMALYSYLSQPQEDYAKASQANLIMAVMAVGAFVVGAASGWQYGQVQNQQQQEEFPEVPEFNNIALPVPQMPPLQAERVTIWVDRAIRESERKI
jgi:hypothetical protein